MTGLALFHELAERIPAGIDRVFPGYHGCILATRIAIEVGAYFGVEVEPVSCQLILFNAAFQRHLDAGDPVDVHRWHAEDGSHSVGIGFGGGGATTWDGHLIAMAEDCFGDFSIRQGERPERNIITGAALVGPRPTGSAWTALNSQGTVAQYRLTQKLGFRAAPDWRDEGRRRAISGPLIRELRGQGFDRAGSRRERLGMVG